MADEKKEPAGGSPLPEQLKVAILRGELETVKDLVRRGVPLNQPVGAEGLPTLHYAIYQGKSASARLLIQSGADLNIRATKQQRTPLMLAAAKGNLDVFQALIAAGADIHATDGLGWTALDVAAGCDRPTAGPVVEAAVKAGGGVHRLAGTWGSPLIKACWRGHVSAARVLAAHGADLNGMTANGTPLMQAIDGKRAEVIAALLAAGADPNVRYAWPEIHGGNQHFLGKTPLELARERKLKKIIALLENPAEQAAACASQGPTAPDVPALWKRLRKVLAKADPDRKQSLGKPATAEQLAELAVTTGLTLPDDFKASYLSHNGQEESAEGLYVPNDFLDEPYRLLRLEEIANEWKLWKKLLDSGEFRGQECTPDDGIRPDWWHPGWLPFMSNGGGDSLCVDLAPMERGVVGQVIHMCHESARRPLLARSFAGFLNLLIENWEQQAEE